MKILIVDGDEATRETVERIARQIANTVLVASGGSDALAIVEREAPDLIVTDLRLPQMDGEALIEALKASPVHGAIPIICLSSVDNRAQIERLAVLGITDYILKPIGPVQLADRLRRAVRRRTRQGRATRATSD